MAEMTPAERQERDDQVAELLLAGATYPQVRKQLPTVSRHVMVRVRRERAIPFPPGRRLDPARKQAVEARVAEMLRGGATQAQAAKETGISLPTIGKMARRLGIPTGRLNLGEARSIDEAFTLYAIKKGEHLVWAGPWSGRRPTLLSKGGVYNARRIAFERHHGRTPQGRVFRVATCDDDACIAGDHNTDEILRAARDRNARADALYDQIFGTEGTSS
ncbi:hypothetical protein AB0D38_36835 [Streptomyces sp. NPDC048279]|uniref:hypothetical protein n=1 Tax=Streptomyces sp. NPDC048279 TaxID=3154714 RepID=UPI0034285E78